MKWQRDDGRWLRDDGSRSIRCDEGYLVSWAIVRGRRRFSVWRAVNEARGKSWPGWEVNYQLGERVPAIRFDFLEVFDDVGAARAYCERHYSEFKRSAASV